ncbi:hypothetical protein FJ930_19780 [Mesorhizobium sp. B2-4-15]|uniref:hypothetical protein n=1 Tax=Mesorhizobium sp. B2-4-15 TaxID=2589934 RepID=UPI0011521703|nr:hypothetical protein [Mesorhizobium sp. B2-4-15]TPK70209.1 hypothetical protein FJ930_19780 [Mesorhizobium sp. B2-4-15]
MIFNSARMTPASRLAAQQQLGAFQNAPMPRNIGEGLTSLGSGLEYRQLHRNLAGAHDANGYPSAAVQPSAVQRVANALMGGYNPTGAGVPQQSAPAWTDRGDGQQPIFPAPQPDVTNLSKIFGWGS